LRKKSGQIIRALSRNEAVTVLYRGKAAAVMQPIGTAVATRPAVEDHPAFGMWAGRGDMKDVSAHVRRLRRGRFDADQGTGVGAVSTLTQKIERRNAGRERFSSSVTEIDCCRSSGGR
jgi:hypothetical protein